MGKKKNEEKKYSLFSNIKFAFSFLLKMGKRYMVVLIFSYIALFLSNIVLTYLPSAIVYGVNNQIGVGKLILFIGIFMVLYAVFISLNTVLTAHYNYVVILARTNKAFYKTTETNFKMDYEYIEQKESRDKMVQALDSMGSNDTGLEGLMRNLPEFIYAIIGLLFFGITSAFISYWIIIIILAMVIVYFIIIYFVTKVEGKYYKKKGEGEKIGYYYANTALKEKEAKDIRNYCLSHKIKGIMADAIKMYRKYTLKLRFAWFLPSLEISLFGLIRDLVAYAILINDVINNNLSPTEFSALLATITAFNGYIDLIILRSSSVISCNAGISNIRKFYEYETKFSHENKVDINVLNEPFKIEIKNMSFKYKGSDKYVFKDLNLTIDHNEKLAIVGLNGAGKTTLAKLLVGLYYPSEGEILVNDHNIKDFKIEDYYRYVSIVNQDIEPIAFTIKDNIVANYEYNEEKFNKTLLDSGLKDKVDSLPNKENTYLTTEFDFNGINLSGGETQKLLLARALYKDSKFLILDEPTSALDPIAESELYLKYNELMEDKTSIFISHRLSSTKFCDQIIYIENGEIIEKGTHKELMKKKGKYFKLFNVQAKYYDDSEVGEIL